jgi:hypothetical protein
MNNALMDQLDTVGSGSYSAEDVHLLLRPLAVEPTDVAEKERLIQSGERHYSEMISQESAPLDIHQSLYEKTLNQNAKRMAQDVESLAQGIGDQFQGSTIALVSFVRAGLPLGVLLSRALIDQGRDVTHYGISIVRDRGIDMVAMEAIIEKHGAENIAFVDGWTGKGAISGELSRSFENDARFSDPLPLVVLADPCGKAWMAASNEDWIIPSGILGATVSGLVSRSIWPSDNGLHGCVVYDHLHDHDVSVPFIEAIEEKRKALPPHFPAFPWLDEEKQNLQKNALAVIDRVAEEAGITNLNRIKPGIAEATRAVLRRVPDRVMVQSLDDPDVQLLNLLTERAGIEIQEVGDDIAPYRAITVIQKVS